ncbi:hypothetical protein Ancab_039988 [Ancistrocladus abbreviatus]
MKPRVRALHRSAKYGYNIYLKPGALAQLRDSKIVKRPQIYLHHLLSTNPAAASPTSSSEPETNTAISMLSMEGLPCFAVRTFRSRCLHRKKLAASRPIFNQSQS